MPLHGYSPLPVFHKHPVLPAHYASELDVYRTRETETYTPELDPYTGQTHWVVKRSDAADKKQGPVEKSKLTQKILDFPLYGVAVDRCTRVLVERGHPMEGHADFLLEMQKLRHEVPHAPFVEFLELDQLLRCKNHYDKVPWAHLIQSREVLRYIAMYSQARAVSTGGTPAEKKLKSTRVEFVSEAHGVTCDDTHCRTWFNLGRCGRGDKCKFVSTHKCFVPNCAEPTKHGTVQHRL